MPVRTSEKPVRLERVYSLGVTPSSEEMSQAVDLGKWQVRGALGNVGLVGNCRDQLEMRKGMD